MLIIKKKNCLTIPLKIINDNIKKENKLSANLYYYIKINIEEEVQEEVLRMMEAQMELLRMF